MLDKVLVNHLDQMDVIEKTIDEEIDSLIKGVNIDAVMQDPQGSMLALAEAFKEMLLQNVIPPSIKQGHHLATSIEKLRKGEKIEIPDTNNPKLNEALANDRRPD